MAVHDFVTVQVEYRFAWWFTLYLQALVTFCLLFGTFPDDRKVQRIGARAARFRIVGQRRWRRLV